MAQTKDEPASTPQSPADATIPTSDLILLQRYLNLPETGSLPETASTPLAFLQTYFDLVPASLIHVFAETTTPRDRSRIRQVKARRMVWAGLGGASQGRGAVGDQRPAELSAEEGWKRFPLLWERLGGDPLGPTREAAIIEHASRPLEIPPHGAVGNARMGRGVAPRSTSGGTGGLFGAMDDEEEDEPTMSNIPLGKDPTPSRPLVPAPPPTAPPSQTSSQRVQDEAQWPSHSFMPGSDRASVLQVNRLGGLMRDLEEEREAVEVVEARRRERRGQTAAEREEVVDPVVGDERDVKEAFERHLLELFLDGKDVRMVSLHVLSCMPNIPPRL